MAIGHQSFYQTQLTSSISDTDLVIPVDNPPIPSEGFLVIEGTVEAKREIIYYTSKDGTSVTCPSGAGNGRGYDGTTAVSHLQGAAVVMAPVGAMFDQLGDVTVNSITIGGTPSAEGWSPLGATPDTITANGNRSYDLVFNGTDLTDTITEGMRVRSARTVTASNTSFSLDGTNDYYVKTSPNKMTWTDDFAAGFWIYPTAYQDSVIASRYNGTSGWQFRLNSSGQVQMLGYNAGSSNVSYIQSYQSVPLNKWTFVAAQLDMSAFTATTTTSYIMINGVDVPAAVTRGGTNPTALVQAGNFEVGSQNGGLFPFAGYIGDGGVFSAKVTQATMLTYMNQPLIGTETNLASAYKNGSVTDLNTTTPNNLTATNGATTVASSPFGNRGVSTTIDYGIVMKKAFSTNTTLTVQVPEGCTIPTSGGVSSVDYSINDVPYGFPRDKSKWDVLMLLKSDVNQATPSTGVRYNMGGLRITAPIGRWTISAKVPVQMTKATAGVDIKVNLSTSPSAISGDLPAYGSYSETVNNIFNSILPGEPLSVDTATPIYMLFSVVVASQLNMATRADNQPGTIKLDNAYI